MAVKFFRIAVLLSLLAPAASAQDAQVWTDKPTHVEPRLQELERLPRASNEYTKSVLIRFPYRIDMHDSVSFTANGQEFVLEGLKPVPKDRLCKSMSGSRWPCGRIAAIFTASQFRNKAISCETSEEGNLVRLTKCERGPEHLIEAVVSAGHAFADPENERLYSLTQRAKADHEGFWGDAECYANNGDC